MKKVVLGVLVIALGVVLLLDNLGYLRYTFKSVLLSWPMFIIAIGILNLFGRRSYFSGLVIILIGVFFMIPRIFYFPFNFAHLLWPVLLIAVGLLIIARRSISERCHREFHAHFKDEFHFHSPEVKDVHNYIDTVNVFGGTKSRIVSQNFMGGKITAIFGGSEIDLTGAKLAQGTNIIDMVCIFGGTTLIVPSDWRVRSEVVSILGGFADKRFSSTGTPDADRELVIKGIAMLGGGEIKSI